MLNVALQVTESALRFLSGAMGSSSPCTDSSPANYHRPPACRALPESTGSSSAAAPETIVNEGDLRTTPRRLRTAVCQFIGHSVRTDCPRPIPPQSDISRPIHNLQATQLRWALSWWNVMGDTYLPAAPLCCAVQRHLDIASFVPSQTFKDKRLQNEKRHEIGHLQLLNVRRNEICREKFWAFSSFVS